MDPIETENPWSTLPGRMWEEKREKVIEGAGVGWGHCSMGKELAVQE